MKAIVSLATVILGSLVWVAFVPGTARAADYKPEPGYISLFNGKDLTGWGYRTNNFDGKTQSDDGRYSAANGILVVHPHSPRLEQTLWTTREFPRDFILKFEFRAEVNADSGNCRCGITWSRDLTKTLKSTNHRIGTRW